VGKHGKGLKRLMAINNKFNEDVILAKVKEYIAKTYTQHYGSGSIQTTEVTFDAGHGESFCIGNILKYAQRFGKKEGRNEKDLYKIIHYTIMLLGEMEKERQQEHKNYLDHLQEGAE
jgi:hypothetical protein